MEIEETIEKFLEWRLRGGSVKFDVPCTESSSADPKSAAECRCQCATCGDMVMLKVRVTRTKLSSDEEVLSKSGEKLCCPVSARALKNDSCAHGLLMGFLGQLGFKEEEEEDPTDYRRIVCDTIACYRSRRGAGRRAGTIPLISLRILIREVKITERPVPDVSSRDHVERCSVCFVALPPGTGRRVTRLPCRHLCHTRCIRRWRPTTNFCPVCRHRLPVSLCPTPKPRVDSILRRISLLKL